ncbi:hypothetical protein C8Q77DRAFT_112447 [Trametes polyzona]|nr:hypothetical protein C8Q77DRAFT_112447 [Trametes polyzona]
MTTIKPFSRTQYSSRSNTTPGYAVCGAVPVAQKHIPFTPLPCWNRDPLNRASAPMVPARTITAQLTSMGQRAQSKSQSMPTVSPPTPPFNCFRTSNPAIRKL